MTLTHFLTIESEIHTCARRRHPMVIDMCHIDAKVDAVIYTPEARILINRFPLSHINFAPDIHYIRTDMRDTFQVICISNMQSSKRSVSP